jgi:hypothetical protein
MILHLWRGWTQPTTPMFTKRSFDRPSSRHRRASHRRVGRARTLSPAERRRGRVHDAHALFVMGAIKVFADRDWEVSVVPAAALGSKPNQLDRFGRRPAIGRSRPLVVSEAAPSPGLRLNAQRALSSPVGVPVAVVRSPGAPSHSRGRHRCRWATSRNRCSVGHWSVAPPAGSEVLPRRSPRHPAAPTAPDSSP